MVSTTFLGMDITNPRHAELLNKLKKFIKANKITPDELNMLSNYMIFMSVTFKQLTEWAKIEQKKANNDERK